MSDAGDDLDGLAEVIPLPGLFKRGANALEAKLDELPVRQKPRDFAKPDCRHLSTVVCDRERVVTCRRCDAVLDPITVLVELARRSESIVKQGSMLRSQVDGLMQTKLELERAERNAKARIRSARKRAPDQGAVEAAARAAFEARAAISWDSLQPARREEYIRQLLPALDAYAAYEPPAEEGTATA